jgi:cystathionine gamma-synthase
MFASLLSAVAGNVELWKPTTSLGGFESLIEHRAAIEGEGPPCPGDQLRLSAGL